MTGFVVWFQQPGMTDRAADVLQYLIAAGIVACIGLLIHLERRVGTIETVLTRPETGLETALVRLRKDVDRLERRRAPREDALGDVDD